MDTPVSFNDLSGVPLPRLYASVSMIAHTLRGADRREIAAFYTEDGVFDLDVGFRLIAETAEASEEVFEMTVNGLPAVLAGATPTVGGVREVWLMATPALYDAPRAFLRESLVLTHKWAQDGKLIAHVDARHEESLSWLKGLGFSDQGRVPHPTDPALHQIIMVHNAVSNHRRRDRRRRGRRERRLTSPDRERD
jgi:GAF domain-containing protein